MPVLFVGHGNPMNAITDNRFAKGWEQQGATIPRPAAVLCISAHWESNGTFLTAMERPRTIHDFGGFPDELFAVEYPAPGDPVLAEEIQKNVTGTGVKFDYRWGLDHGCWSVLMHVFPKADIPIVQMSLDYTKPPQWHYELGKELAALRTKGVLLVGSGNIVHNLQATEWHNTGGADWAIEADSRIKGLITEGNHTSLMHYDQLGKDVMRGIPTPEHYLPLLYVLALQSKDDRVSFFNEGLELGSMSMTSLRLQ